MEDNDNYGYAVACLAASMRHIYDIYTIILINETKSKIGY